MAEMYFYRVKNVALSQDLFARGVQYGRLAMLIMIVVLLMMRTPAAGLDLTLAWDANVENDLAGYKLYYGYHAGEYGEPIDVGNVTQYELTSLSDDTIYYFAVTAYDTDTNESGYSRVLKYYPDLARRAVFHVNQGNASLTNFGGGSGEIIVREINPIEE